MYHSASVSDYVTSQPEKYPLCNLWTFSKFLWKRFCWIDSESIFNCWCVTLFKSVVFVFTDYCAGFSSVTTWIIFLLNPFLPTVPQMEHSILAKIAKKFGQKWVNICIIIIYIYILFFLNIFPDYIQPFGDEMQIGKYGGSCNGHRMMNQAARSK